MATSQAIGFIGLGTMGLPMALNLIRAGIPLVIWNRSKERCTPLTQAGASLVETAAAVFDQCETVILMLADEAATDTVLARGTSDFPDRIAGRRVLAMGTVAPDYSQALRADIHSVGGRYVEGPVSGSRKPAELGQLVGLLAGDADDLAIVRPLLAPLCQQVFECGGVPGALRMKLAVNVFLITLVTGLAEAAHFAARHDLDLERFVAILNAGPMASDVSRIKAVKLLQRDFARQAGISDVLKNSRLVVEATRDAAIASPLMQACLALYRESEAIGLGDDDMVAVVRAIEERTAAGSSAAECQSR